MVLAEGALFDFDAALSRQGVETLRREGVETVQVNVGKRCNQACHHCHVEAGPKRTEQMQPRTAERILRLLDASHSVRTVDITGGAPELNDSFRHLVRESRRRGKRVIDRCNLTILFEPGQEDLATFLADEGVDIVASLPCYTAENVEKQRGRDVFARSIEALRRFNALGYGDPDGQLRLDLVYNPLGATLPPPQSKLERDYRERLGSDFGVRFNRLLTLTNMPIRRFGDMLARSGQHQEYMCLLVNHFNAETLAGLMCRTLVSIGWDGKIYDCDFNQMLDLPAPLPKAADLWHIRSFDEASARPIVTGPHCFGCTAGSGSSCGGSLA